MLLLSLKPWSKNWKLHCITTMLWGEVGEQMIDLYIWNKAFPNGKQDNKEESTTTSHLKLLRLWSYLRYSITSKTSQEYNHNYVCTARESILGQPVTSKGVKELNPSKQEKWHVCIYEGRGAG